MSLFISALFALFALSACLEEVEDPRPKPKPELDAGEFDPGRKPPTGGGYGSGSGSGAGSGSGSGSGSLKLFKGDTGVDGWRV